MAWSWACHQSKKRSYHSCTQSWIRCAARWYGRFGLSLAQRGNIRYHPVYQTSFHSHASLQQKPRRGPLPLVWLVKAYICLWYTMQRGASPTLWSNRFTVRCGADTLHFPQKAALLTTTNPSTGATGGDPLFFPPFQLLTLLTWTAHNSRHESASPLAPNRCRLSINHRPPFCWVEQKALFLWAW